MSLTTNDRIGFKGWFGRHRALGTRCQTLCRADPKAARNGIGSL